MEESFDETALSSLEARMARLLHGSAAANRALAQEQAAVKTLISDISHQARTPMANVLLYAALLDETDVSEVQRARLIPLRQQAEKLHFLLENLLRASRLETGLLQLNPTVGPVADLMEQAAGEARAAARTKKLTLTVHSTEAAACFDPKWTPEGTLQSGGQCREIFPRWGPGGPFRHFDRQFLPAGCDRYRPRHSRK